MNPESGCDSRLFLDVSIANLASGFVSFPDQRRISGLRITLSGARVPGVFFHQQLVAFISRSRRPRAFSAFTALP